MKRSHLLLGLALVAALSTALPAVGASPDQLVKKALKLAKKADKRSKKALRLAQKVSAKTGQQGAKGDKGDLGPPGPLLETLPSGRTLRGVYRVTGRQSGIDTSAISFEPPLAAPPAPHFIPEGGALTAACGGSPASPEAAPGNFCVYEGSDFNATIQAIGNPVNNTSGQTSRYGASVIAADDPADPAGFTSSGTWAVTAP